MTIPHGADTFFGFSQAGQTALTTAQPGTYNYFPSHPGGVTEKQEAQFSAQARGGEAHHGRVGNFSADGPLPMDWVMEGMVPILKNALSHSSATLQAGPPAVYRDTIIVPTDLAFEMQYGQTFYEHLGIKTKQLLGCFVTNLQWTIQNNFLLFTPTIIAAKREFIASVTPTFGSVAPAVVAGELSVSITTSANTHNNVGIRGLTINVPIPTELRYSDHSNTATHAVRTGKIIPEINFTWDYNDDTTLIAELETDVDAQTPVSCTITLTGREVLGSPATDEQIQWTCPSLVHKPQDPSIGGSGPIERPFAFTAQRDFSGGNPAMTILVDSLVQTT